MNFIHKVQRKIKSYFTLKFVENSFIDVVSGKNVAIYKDCYGDYFLKHTRWAFFSVKIKY